MTTLLLVRHAASEWNEERRIQGWTDPPLSERGIHQARRLAQRLKQEDIVAVYSSDLQRAAQTAQIIADALGVPLTTDRRLRERRLGDLEGLTVDEVAERFPVMFQAWQTGNTALQAPGAEDLAAFEERVRTTVGEIVHRHAGQTVAVVSHGGVIAAFLKHLLGLNRNLRSPFSFGNASLTVISIDGARPRILLLNDLCHLTEET